MENNSQCAEIAQLVLEECEPQVETVQEMVIAAAQNHEQGIELMNILLKRHGTVIKITQEVVITAARNHEQGFELMHLLLKKLCVLAARAPWLWVSVR